jgi:hypothetical protein
MGACDEFDTLFMSTAMSTAFPVSNIRWCVIQLFPDGLWQIVKDDSTVVCWYDERFLLEMLFGNIFFLLLHAWPLGLLLAGRGMEGNHHSSPINVSLSLYPRLK